MGGRNESLEKKKNQEIEVFLAYDLGATTHLGDENGLLVIVRLELRARLGESQERLCAVLVDDDTGRERGQDVAAKVCPERLVVKVECVVVAVGHLVDELSRGELLDDAVAERGEVRCVDEVGLAVVLCERAVGVCLGSGQEHVAQHLGRAREPAELEPIGRQDRREPGRHA